jgi:hypothetical protein
MNLVNRVLFTGGLAAFAAGALIGAHAAPISAAPYFERLSASACQAQLPPYNQGFPTGDTTPTAYENYHSATMYFTCPFVHKTNLMKQNVSSLTVYVNDQNDNGTGSSSAYQVQVRACSTWHSANTAACGPSRYSSGTGYQPVTLSGTDLSGVTSYPQPYLFVSLPRIDGLASSIVGLYFYQN